MAFDTFYLGAVKKELKEKLTGARVLKIHQPEAASIIMRCHGREGKEKLFISAHPQRARIHLCHNERENPQSAPLFCMVLRKHLEGAKILSFEQKPLERILHISFLTRNELGDDTLCTLIIEIMGKHSNIILINSQGQIIDGIRRYNHLLSRYREVLPGKAYIMPPPQQKTDFTGLDEAALARLFFCLPPHTQLKEALALNIAGFSPLMLKELIVRSGLPGALTVDQMGQYELRRILSAAGEILNTVRLEEFCPLILGAKSPEDFAPFPLMLWEGEKTKAYTSPSQAAEDFFNQKENQIMFSSRQRELYKIMEGHSQRLKKKLALQEEDLAQADSKEKYKLYGELLSANLYSLAKGAKSAELENFYTPGEIISIPLDPSQTPGENMSRFFRLYTKAKKAREAIKEQISVNREELSYIESVLVNIEQSGNLEELAETREELVKSGYAKEKRKNKPQPKAEKLPPRSFLSPEGYEILVGRNNNQNDRLTLKTAAKNDIWLHAKDIPGSHTIIRSGDKTVSKETLILAANIAAWYSRAKNSSKVAVDYTTADQVKKPHGARPGKVIYFKQKTLIATPFNPEE